MPWTFTFDCFFSSRWHSSHFLLQLVWLSQLRLLLYCPLKALHLSFRIWCALIRGLQRNNVQNKNTREDALRKSDWQYFQDGPNSSLLSLSH